jgi:hypothetical protein
MAKVETISAATAVEPVRGPRAPAIAMKLDAAREKLGRIRDDVGQTALDAAEGVEGADERLAALRANIAGAEQVVEELTKAFDLAAKYDRQAAAAGAADMRLKQFEVMQAKADLRLRAVTRLMEAIGVAAEAYGEYVAATNQMVVALPTGTRLSFISMGRNGYGGSWVGDLKGLLEAEAWRLMPKVRGGEKRLPFAVAPELTNDDHTKLPSAIEVMTFAQESILRDVEIQMQRLNAESMAQAKGEAA